MIRSESVDDNEDYVPLLVFTDSIVFVVGSLILYAPA